MKTRANVSPGLVWSMPSMVSRWLVVLALLLPLGWLLWPARTGEQTFGFRDAGHYYYPLYEYVASRWSDGSPPLWNPLENGGQPLAADATAAVYYPGKLILQVPATFTVCWNLYVAAHLILAATTMYWAARALSVSPAAATTAALSYVLGGILLSQHANIVYLVGAAWLPAAFWAIFSLAREPGIGSCAGFAASLAMMVLGGDPELAYLTVLAGLAYVWMSPAEIDAAAPASEEASWWPSFFTASRLWFASAVLFAIGLAAVQVLPALEWSAQTERAHFNSPRSLYEIPQFLSRAPEAQPQPAAEPPSISAGLFGAPESGTHHEHVYFFSVGPWRLIEFLWPNFHGREYPENERWGAVLPRENTTWSPSLYMGLLPLLLAFGSLYWFGGPIELRWLTWTALLAIVGSFGWFGLGWIWSACTGTTPLGEPVGGLYWLMTVVLPGFVQFRYPAKLLVLAACALSLLAARGFDHTWTRRGQSRLHFRLLSVIGVSAVAIVVLLAIGSSWRDWLANVEPSPLYGPFLPSAAWWRLLGDVAHPLIVALIGVALLWLAARPAWRGVVPWMAVGVVAFELVVAHGWMVLYVPSAAIAKSTAPESHAGTRAFRDEPEAAWRPAWRTFSSPNRQAEIVTWERATLRPKYHLLERSELVESRGSGQGLTWDSLLYVARTHGTALPGDRVVPDVELLKRLGATFLIGFRDRPFRSEWRLDRRGDVRGIALGYAPRAWICHNPRSIDLSNVDSPEDWTKKLDELWYADGKLVDLQQSAVMETDQTSDALLKPFVEIDAPPAAVGVEFVEGLGNAGDRVSYLAFLNQPGLVTFRDAYDAGWVAEVRSSRGGESVTVPVVRVQGVSRGVYLPEGQWKVTLVYRPASYRWGLAISLGAVVLLIGLGFVLRREVGRQGDPVSAETAADA